MTPRRRFHNVFGFTLIELLVVMVVILILATISFGISRGVSSAQARSKAQGEMAALGQALEQFKLRYGDYPWIQGDNNQAMLYALTGRLVMNRDAGGLVEITTNPSTENADVQARPKFIDMTRFTVTGTATDPNRIVDPWGNPYQYFYKEAGSEGTWRRFGYVLFSYGPRGVTTSTILNPDGTFAMTPDDLVAAGIILHE